MADDLAELFYELILATRILANQKVLDAFGHVSVRHPRDPGRYFISRHQAPELAEVSDLIEMDLDSQPVRPTEFRMYSERVIHGEIYKARPDVNAVCHHHSHDVLPFCISGRELVPVFHLPAVIGHVPFWDQHDEFGDKPEEGASLARTLGKNWMVLMRRHGATAAGASLREMTFRTVYGCENAALQSKAMAHGHVDHLSPGEMKLSSEHSVRPLSTNRAWNYWVRHVERADLMPAKASTKHATASPQRAKTNSAAKRKAKKRR
jgi:ribulose-5-phosphate 4-epimerase/fuculose-1-phosphate aldolase